MPRSAQDLPEAIEWHEGMLLAPQHFQQLALRGEELTTYHMLTAQPFHWGVRHLKADPVLLVSGIFRVLEMEAVLPDGLIIHHVQGEGEPLELDLTQHADALARGRLRIHVAVPVRRPGGRPTAGDLPRYRSTEGAPVSDETSGENALQIPRMTPRLSLMATRSLPEKYTGFPVAEIALKEEAFTQTGYCPPALWVSRTSPVGEACSALATKLREKAVFLAERAKTPVGQSDRPLLQQTQTVIHALVAGLPQFEAILKTDRCHPFVLYLALNNIVGHMTAVGGALVPPSLPAYDHDDMKASFDAAIQFAIQMLDRVSEAYIAIPFSEEEGVFKLTLDPSWCDDALTLGVRARPEMTEPDVIAWMESALIGVEGVLTSMQERRVLGAGRRRIDRDQALDLVPTRGVVLFRVEIDPEFIEAGEPLLVLSGDRGRSEPPQEIVLYVRNPAGPDAG